MFRIFLIAIIYHCSHVVMYVTCDPLREQSNEFTIKTFMRGVCTSGKSSTVCQKLSVPCRKSSVECEINVGLCFNVAQINIPDRSTIIYTMISLLCCYYSSKYLLSDFHTRFLPLSLHASYLEADNMPIV